MQWCLMELQKTLKRTVVEDSTDKMGSKGAIAVDYAVVKEMLDLKVMVI